MKKVPKSHLGIFKREFTRRQQLLGLTCYRIVFEQKDLPQDYARLDVNEDGMIGVAYLCTKLDSAQDARAYRGPEEHAKHEVIHLLSHRLAWLAQKRYATEDEISREWEALVRRLEKIIP